MSKFSKHSKRLTNLRFKYEDLCLKRKLLAKVLRTYKEEASRGFCTTEYLRARKSYGEFSRMIRKTRLQIDELQKLVFVGSLLEDLGFSPDMTSAEIAEQLRVLKDVYDSNT